MQNWIMSSLKCFFPTLHSHYYLKKVFAINPLYCIVILLKGIVSNNRVACDGENTWKSKNSIFSIV